MIRRFCVLNSRCEFMLFPASPGELGSSKSSQKTCAGNAYRDGIPTSVNFEASKLEHLLVAMLSGHRRSKISPSGLWWVAPFLGERGLCARYSKQFFHHHSTVHRLNSDTSGATVLPSRSVISRSFCSLANVIDLT